METYEIHNREAMLKGMKTCAKECCNADCSYYGKTGNGKTCRARLLEDAMAALVKDKNDLDEMETAARTFREERDKLRGENEELKEYALALEKEGQEARADRDKLKQEMICYIQQRDQAAADLHAVREQNKNLRETCQVQQDRLIEERDAFGRECVSLTAENKALHERCQVQQNEINALVLKLGKQDDETDRPSVCPDDQLRNEYKRGYLDAMEYCFRELCKRAGGGCRHE